MASVRATYCATVAVAVKEMSIPPATRTTRRPAARMPTKAFEVRRSNRFWRVKKLSVTIVNPMQKTTMTASSQNSWLLRKVTKASRIDSVPQRGLARPVRLELADDPALAHDEHAVGVIVDLRDLVRDHEDCDPARREIAHELVDAVLGVDVDTHRRRVEDQK